jgi:hypothetical protein
MIGLELREGGRTTTARPTFEADGIVADTSARLS